MKITHEIKRKLIQIAAFGFTNTHLENFGKGKIYTGSFKKFCNPGMNCYSCPAARTACPIGALQAVSGSMDFNFSFYVVGFILAIGALMGRWVCGFVCPFGLIQDLLAKIPTRKHRIWKPLTYVKYVLLAVFVLAMPVLVTNFLGMGKPAFCQYICPVGTLEGGIPLLLANEELRQTIGPLFFVKLTILIGTIVGILFCKRFFCKVMCPLGAIYGLLNKISIYHLEVDKSKCVHCHKCALHCDMDVDPVAKPRSPECIRCGKCAHVCPTGAIKLGFGSGREASAVMDPKNDTDGKAKA